MKKTKKIKYNSSFTSGEDNILEQASMILKRKGEDYYIKSEKYNKRLIIL